MSIFLCLIQTVRCLTIANRNRQSTFKSLSPFLPIKLPKYFASEWSYASYRLPAPTAHISLQSAMRGGGERGDGGKLRSKDSEGVVIPDDGDEGLTGREQAERCVVGWIEVPVKIPGAGHKKSGTALTKDSEPEEEMQYQLVALTYSGCWYRLSVPSSSSTLSSSPTHSASVQSPTPVPSSTPTSARSNPVSIPGHARSSSGSTSQQRSPRSSPSGLPSISPRSPSSSTPPRPSPLSQASSAASTITATPTVVSTARPRSSTPTGAQPSANVARKGKEREREVSFATFPAGSTSTRIRQDSYTSSSDAGSVKGQKDSKAGDKAATGSGSGGNGKTSRKCSVEEFRRFGRWDGWG